MISAQKMLKWGLVLSLVALLATVVLRLHRAESTTGKAPRGPLTLKLEPL